MKSKYTYSEEELRTAVSESSSIRQVLIKINLVPIGANYRNVRNRIILFNIDTSHFKRTNNAGRSAKSIDDYLNNKVIIASNDLKKKLIKDNYLEKKCSNCCNTEWQGLPIPLELDHIDGNRFNNSLVNLRLLCPNCHAQTSNYRGKNKRGRKQTEKNDKGETVDKVLSTPCKQCGRLKHHTLTFCSQQCARLSQRKVNRPTKEELIEELKHSSFRAVGRKYGVTDNAIRKWLK